MTRLKAPAPHLFPDLIPTPRELRWFAHIDRHGPQSSAFLFEATRDTHRCKDTALRRMQALRAVGYLRAPVQQEQIAKANFNPRVYDLTTQGFETLSYHHQLERHARPTGHWWHAFWVASVSSAIEIAAKRAGHAYIPAAQILGIRNATLAIPLTKGKLIPDQIFAIRYPDGYRAFALEVDRGTEPVRSTAARKSLKRSATQYREIFAGRLHQSHYGLKSNLLVLWVFNSASRERQFRDLLTEDDVAIPSTVCDGLFPRLEHMQGICKTLGI